MDDRHYKALALEPDADDLELHRRNADPALLTARLRELVPLLAVVDCTVAVVEHGRVELSLPLLPSAMNQNGTHQASVLYLVADYCLGVAMFASLPGTYTTGVHDRCAALPIQFWLKRGEVLHLAPGAGPLRAVATLDADEIRALRAQLVARGRAEFTGVVRIHEAPTSRDAHATHDFAAAPPHAATLVAEVRHTMGIYEDAPRVPGKRVNPLAARNLKTSALMIAGLRDDALSRRVAGDQGVAIAARMALATPQLPSLVAARDADLLALLASEARGFTQVVVLGVGLDIKALRSGRDGVRWYGVDLREMQRERELRLAVLGPQHVDPVVSVVADLRVDGWEDALLRAGLRTTAPTLIVVEGLSMYLERDELLRLLRGARRLVGAPSSRLWMDHVSAALFDLPHAEVRAFLASMSRLGEPFVTGFDAVRALGESGWTTERVVAAARVAGNDDAVHAHYLFSVLAPADLGVE